MYSSVLGEFKTVRMLQQHEQSHTPLVHASASHVGLQGRLHLCCYNSPINFFSSPLQVFHVQRQFSNKYSLLKYLSLEVLLWIALLFFFSLAHCMLLVLQKKNYSYINQSINHVVFLCLSFSDFLSHPLLALLTAGKTQGCTRKWNVQVSRQPASPLSMGRIPPLHIWS